jgi:O-antigen ligase
MATMSAGLRQPVPWLLALPALAAACVLLWGKGAELHPGMQPGRAAGAFLLVGTVIALVLPSRLRWSWSSPWPWLTAALLWQGASVIGWAVVREPGLVWLSERAAGLLTAIGLAAWFRGTPGERLLPAVGACAAGMLVLGVVSGGPWAGAWMTGPDLPFGNPNFLVGGALPLLGLTLPFLRRPSALIACGLGLAAAVIIGSGKLSGDACRAVWPGLVALFGLWAILQLPARSHGWILAIGEIGVLLLFAGLISGLVALPDASPSSHYRLAIWRAAFDAIGQHPLLGTGPASAIVVLQEQIGSPVAWLWVPSYAEHAHNEYLNAVIDGGVIGASLLLAGLLLTLVPLWRRRAEPAAQALLIAWGGVLTQAMIESHLSQPGPVLLLAVLAGATWALTGQESATVGTASGSHPTPSGASPVAPRRADSAVVPAIAPSASSPGYLVQVFAAVLVAATSFAMLAREFSDGGSPTMIEFRAERRMEAEPANAPVIADEVRKRLGSLDRWLTLEAKARHEHHDDPGAAVLVIEQLARLPVDPQAVGLALILRDGRRKANQRFDDLQSALEQARRDGTALMQEVPELPRTAQLRAVLKRLYLRI